MPHSNIRIGIIKYHFCIVYTGIHRQPQTICCIIIWLCRMPRCDCTRASSLQQILYPFYCEGFAQICSAQQWYLRDDTLKSRNFTENMHALLCRSRHTCHNSQSHSSQCWVDRTWHTYQSRNRWPTYRSINALTMHCWVPTFDECAFLP